MDHYDRISIENTHSLVPTPFRVPFRGGLQENKADKSSRCAVNRNTTEHEDTETPCFLVEITEDEESEGGLGANMFNKSMEYVLYALLAEPADTQGVLAQISIETLIVEQDDDRILQDVQSSITWGTI